MFTFVNSDALDADVSGDKIKNVKVRTLSDRHWSSGFDLRYTKTVSISLKKVYPCLSVL